MDGSKLYDVAIIGAGPAGLSSAYNCAKQGLDAVILEEHPKVGEPVHCGECLSTWATKRMGLELPPEAIAVHAKGIRVVFPDGTETIFKEEGYALDKNVFEQYLAVRAQGAGARLELNTRVTGMKRENGIWALSSQGKTFSAKAVIDASGYESVASKYTGINKERYKTTNGAQYLMEDVPNDGYLEFFIWPRLAPEGYLWIIPKKDGRANVGLCSPDAKGLHANLKQFIKEKGLDGKRILKPFGGLIPASGPLPKTYADGLLLVGDAAGFTSPMFEGGTQLSLKSGEMAATVLANALKHGAKPSVPDLNDVQSMTDHAKNEAALAGAAGAAAENDPLNAHTLSEYENAWRAEFPPYEKLLVGRHMFYSFSEADLNKLGQILPRDITTVSTLQKMQIAAQALMHYKGRAVDVRSALDTFAYSTGKMYGW